MILDAQAANAFIVGYTKLMVEIHGSKEKRKRPQLLEVLAAARERLMANPSLIEPALTSLAARNDEVSPNVVSAVRTLEVKQWIFLKDMRAYSVFIDPSGKAAYGVLGLTDRVRDITGGSGLVVETGVVRYLGRFVCDGIVARPVWLGRNYRSDFNDLLIRLKEQGHFHTDASPDPAPQNRRTRGGALL
jgi:hypothetical protein